MKFEDYTLKVIVTHSDRFSENMDDINVGQRYYVQSVNRQTKEVVLNVFQHTGEFNEYVEAINLFENNKSGAV